MSRIATVFEALKKEGRAALIPFITCGDPDIATSRAILEALPGAGADIIELGLPFSDPMADGPVIQAASERALRAGTRAEDLLGLVRDFRTRHQTPIVIMTYANPVEVYGTARFCREAAEAGVDGLLLVDVPVEEMDSFAPQMAENGLDPILLAAPTSTENRLVALGQQGKGFVYFVSVTGVTGVKRAHSDALRAHLEQARRFIQQPIGVGFGISSPEQVREIAAFADAVIVGSAVVRKIEEGLEQRDKIAEDVAEFVRSLRRALDPH
ncbi:MAG: tryptophan synthase subunit alpha [Alphaproteobacteria bacterium CG_4_10_14_0_2_um_filter_63_37]|nr:MAG: tryptophan synthase subunit alpha [Proteobacteria bacterium CG1_02_64_396]PJA24133.1 MAG: tryptophan synthase subunit alpha [Alphaproteobacteria bacterium CG_4_10_14_0_2_um_filter_63_37]